uniref:Uncharacterized protein n=1 Tax=Brassica oleracea TaxID=3712 RepID=A0A3P6GAB7_BRAOL|nr:unnamed protein product [Brassica oleracea]
MVKAQVEVKGKARRGDLPKTLMFLKHLIYTDLGFKSNIYHSHHQP